MYMIRLHMMESVILHDSVSWGDGWSAANEMKCKMSNLSMSHRCDIAASPSSVRCQIKNVTKTAVVLTSRFSVDCETSKR